MTLFCNVLLLGNYCHHRVIIIMIIIVIVITVIIIILLCSSSLIIICFFRHCSYVLGLLLTCLSLSHIYITDSVVRGYG